MRKKLCGTAKKHIKILNCKSNKIIKSRLLFDYNIAKLFNVEIF